MPPPPQHPLISIWTNHRLPVTSTLWGSTTLDLIIQALLSFRHQGLDNNRRHEPQICQEGAGAAQDPEPYIAHKSTLPIRILGQSPAIIPITAQAACQHLIIHPDCNDYPLGPPVITGKSIHNKARGHLRLRWTEMCALAWSVMDHDNLT